MNIGWISQRLVVQGPNDQICFTILILILLIILLHLTLHIPNPMNPTTPSRHVEGPYAEQDHFPLVCREEKQAELVVLDESLKGEECDKSKTLETVKKLTAIWSLTIKFSLACSRLDIVNSDQSLQHEP
jgi:hypothetical protein